MDNAQKIKRLFEILDEIDIYERSIGKLGFDMQCVAPPAGMDRAGEDMAYLGKRVYELKHSDEFISLVGELRADGEGLSELQKKAVEHLGRDLDKTRNISAEFSYEYDRATNRAYTSWLKAKSKKNYELFKPNLAEVIKASRKAVLLRGERSKTVYDAMLDDYEPGWDIERMDAFFEELKARIPPLIRRIGSEGKRVRSDYLTRRVAVAAQELFSRRLLETEGLDKDRLVLMTTEHPFTDHYGRDDVRVTTHFYEENFISNVFSTLHEGGHALFMQNEPAAHYDNHVSDRMTSAMHECVSRFYENVIGRSREFITYLMPLIRAAAPGTFDDVSADEMYEAVNKSEPGLIRMEADELTYSIHILIRYELEKAFINGDIDVDGIPAMWNAKYKEYLGLDVPDDAAGCLQDVHWTGAYGYFPSYALGNAYGVQILRTMQKDIDVFALAAKGDLAPIRDWLTDKVFSVASVCDPDEWIRRICGEPFNAGYYLDYLEDKFTKIYFGEGLS